jgi:hypothetical protein
MANGQRVGERAEHDVSAQEPLTEAGEELNTVDIGKQLERVKWFLWHGNVGRALDTRFEMLSGMGSRQSSSWKRGTSGSTVYKPLLLGPDAA